MILMPSCISWRLWCSVLLYLLVSLQHTQCGIVGLSKFFRASYKNAWVADVSKVGTIKVDHLCIDMNQVLHGCFRSTKNPDHIMAKIFNKLDEIFTMVSPNKSLVLAFDGCAPYAKLQTQQKRRKTHPEISLITPGTEFMNSMESVMICYLLQRYSKHKLSNIAVFISDGTCPGEGELKIIDWIQHHMPRPAAAGVQSRSILTQPFVKANALSSRDSVVICGSDSDILVQSICMGAVTPNTMVLQLGSDGRDSLCNISALITGLVSSAGVSWKELVAHHRVDQDSVGVTRSAVSQEGEHTANDSKESEHKKTVAILPSAEPSQIGEFSANSPKPDNCFHPMSQLRSLHIDLAVLFALQGNDYLPKMRCISNQRALHAYSEAMRELTVAQRYLVDLRTNTFNFVALWALMKKIDENTRRFSVSLPVVVPEAISVVHTMLQKSGKKGNTATGTDTLSWDEVLVTGAGVRYLPDVGTGDGMEATEYYSSVPVGATDGDPETSNSTVFYFLNESDHSVACAPAGGSGLSLWRGSFRLNNKQYMSLKLFPTRRSARRHCAEMVLKDLDERRYDSYIRLRNAGREALLKMKQAAAAELEEREGAATTDTEVGNVECLADDQQGAGELDTDDVIVSDGPDSQSADQDDWLREGDTTSPGESDVDDNSSLEVSAQEYLTYLRDSDVEEFLKGILWMIHMYSQGQCSDQGYTYSTRPPITALAVLSYIERRTKKGNSLCKGNSIVVQKEAGGNSIQPPIVSNKPTIDLIAEQQQFLSERVSVPFSDSRSLSADAASLCVLSEEGVSFLPPRLREPWRWMAARFYSKLEDGNLGSTSYEDLVRSLEECFAVHRMDGASVLSTSPGAKEEHSHPTPLTANLDDTTASLAGTALREGAVSGSSGDSKGSTGSARGKKWTGRRGIHSWTSTTSKATPAPSTLGSNVREVVSQVGAADLACAQLGANLYGTLDSVLVSTPHNSWTILSNAALLKSRGYLGAYKNKQVRLPLPLSFHTPSKLPPGSVFLRSESDERTMPSIDDVCTQTPSDIP